MEVRLNCCTDSLIYEIGAEDFYTDIAGDVETWFDTSEFDARHPSGIQTCIVIIVAIYGMLFLYFVRSWDELYQPVDERI